MKKFVTKYRLLILAFSLMTAIASLVGAWLLNTTTLFGSFLLNFSAGAITIGITVIIVDFLLQEEQRSQLAPALSHANIELGATCLDLLSAIELLLQTYKNDTQKTRNLEGITLGTDFFEPHIKTIDAIFNQPEATLRTIKLTNKDTKYYETSLAKASATLDKLIDSYFHAMSSEQQSMIFDLHSNVRAAIAYSKAYDSLVKIKGSSNKKRAGIEEGQLGMIVTAQLLFEELKNVAYFLDSPRK